MNKSKKKVLLAASVAGLLAVTGGLLAPGVAYADVACSGINACKGTGDCGGKGHSCAGQNACKGEGWKNVADEAACTAAGGTVYAVPAH